MPIIDLNDNSAVADKLYTLGFTGGNDYVGDLTVITQQATGSASSLFFYLVIVPIFALIATGVLIKELSGSFAGEIATEVSQL